MIIGAVPDNIDDWDCPQVRVVQEYDAQQVRGSLHCNRYLDGQPCRR